MRYLTFALGKGRLAKQTLELFEKIGITCEEMKDKDSMKLIFTNEELKLRFCQRGTKTSFFPCKRTGCSDICRIWRSGYRSRWERYNPGRRT